MRSKDPVGDGAVLTTGQVARMLRVATRTVNKWCDRGHLPHWRLPDSRDRWVSRTVLVAFCRERGIPLSLMKEPRETNP